MCFHCRHARIYIVYTIYISFEIKIFFLPQSKIKYYILYNIYIASKQNMTKQGFAFHVDVATAYKLISDTFTEREICDLKEIQLFPPQKMVSIVQKGSPLRKIITYG